MTSKKFLRSGAHLPVKDLKETLDYYCQVLSFTDPWIFEKKDGGAHRDDMRVLFSEDPAFTDDINNSRHRLPLIWFVDNIEEVMAELLKKDIVMADGLRKHPYGLREFAFIDINGYYVRVTEANDQG